MNGRQQKTTPTTLRTRPGLLALERAHLNMTEADVKPSTIPTKPEEHGAHVLDLPATFGTPGCYGTPLDDEGLPVFGPGASLPVSFAPEFDDETEPRDPDGCADEAWYAERREG